jgi:hypothetical protein
LERAKTQKQKKKWGGTTFGGATIGTKVAPKVVPPTFFIRYVFSVGMLLGGIPYGCKLMIASVGPS